MPQQDVDYDALAKEHGGVPSKEINYDDLAAQHGGTPVKAAKPSAPVSVDYDALAKEHGGTASHLTDPETKAAVARLQDHPVEGASFSAAPSIWQSLKTAVAHPINYLKEVEEDTQEGGGRTVVGRTLGHMQHGSMDDTGYSADKTGIAPIMAGPLQGPVKAVRGALRIMTPPDANKPVGDQLKEAVGGLNELVGGAFQTPGAAIAVIDPAFLPKAVAGGVAQHYAEKGLKAIDVPDEYAQLGGNVAAVLGAHSVEDPSLLVRGAAKTADTVVGKPVRYGLKKILPDTVAPAIEEHIHVPGRTVGLEPSEKALSGLNTEVDAARSHLAIAERNLNRSVSAGIEPTEGVKAAYNRAKNEFTEAIERQAVAEENIPLEKNITNRINLAKNSPSLASRGTDPNIVEAPSPSEYAERWRTPEKKAEYYGQSILFGPKKPNVPYTRMPEVFGEIETPDARSASGELIPREIANVISSKPQGTEGASALGRIALPPKEALASPSNSSPVERIESVIPEAGEIAKNVEEKAHEFGVQLPAESATARSGLKPIDLSRLEPLLNEATGAKSLEPNVPLREQGLGKIKTSGEEPKKLSSDPRKAVLQKAGARPEEIATILQRGTRFDPTSKVGLSKLVEHFGVDLGDAAIGRGKADVAAGTHLPPHEVLQRIIDAGHTPADMVNAINEGKHLPPVSGGSQGSEHAPTFYSKAERVAKEKVSTGSGDSMLSALRNNGVKESEIADLGLDDFLKGKSKVTKEDLQRFITANKPQLKDVDLGGPVNEQRLSLTKLRDKAYMENNQLWSDVLRREPLSTELFNAMEKGDPEEVIQRMPENVRDAAYRFVVTDSLLRNYDSALAKMQPNASPKYGKWTLPGELKNYTERLITLSGNEPEPSPLEWKQNHRGKWAWFSGKDQVSGAYPEESDIDNARQSITLPVGAKQFRSSHWEEPNVLAHVRYDERPSTDGKKTLFLEEIQSDWHQQGKQIGYRAPLSGTQLPDGVFVTRDGDEFQVVSREGNRLLNRNYGSEREAIRAANEHYGPNRYRTGVPNAPFKNNWHELAIKKMLREAAEKGYDRLAWTTGDQQADRYDLSKHIGSIEYDMNSKTLIARNPEGRKVIEEEMEPNQKELARYIGEEPAKKLMDQIEDHPGPVNEDHLWSMYADYYQIREVPDPDDHDGARYAVVFDGDREPLETFDTETAAHRYIEDQIRFEVENYEHEPNPSIRGLDLKTGGEWAKALYDRAIPNFLKSYAKKWGAKVGTTEVSTAEPHSLRYEIVDPQGNVEDAFRNQDGAEHAVSQYNETHRGPGQWTVRDKGKTEKVHSIEITPAMRKSLLQEGQPISQNEPDDLIPTKQKGFEHIEVAV